MSQNNYDWINHLVVENRPSGWYICWPTSMEIYAGPYKTAAAAKGQLTRLKKGYTPAARRPE